MATERWGAISAPYRATAKARAEIEEEKRKIEATVARSELHQQHTRTIGARCQARDDAREALEQDARRTRLRLYGLFRP